MNERMEQEINRTIALLQASMPQRKSEAALSQLLNIAKSEMNPLLLLALFFVSILCGVCMSKDIASPMVTIFCISPLPMLILFHRYVLYSNEPMRELEETFPFSYSEMLVGRAMLISAYMTFVFIALAVLLSHSAGAVRGRSQLLPMYRAADPVRLYPESGWAVISRHCFVGRNQLLRAGPAV